MMKMGRIGYFKKMVSLVLLVALICVSLCGCNKQTLTKSNQKKDNSDKIQIGMCFDSFVIERWQRDRDVFVSMAKELGAEVNVQNANGDANEQKNQIEYFIKKGMDVIVIVCIDSDVICDSVKKAKDAGIKIIAYDRLIAGANVDLYISFDNELVGSMMGQALVSSGLSDGKVIMICGSPNDSNVPMVEKGFREVMERSGNEIIDVVYAEGWRAECASEYVYNNLDKIKEADAIMCGNDDLASRLVHALSEKRLAGKKLVVGQDADLEACQRIVEGTQLMTVYKPIEKLAQAAAEYAVALAKNESISEMEGQLNTIDDGKYMVLYIKISPVSVTEKNMNEVIIKSGFHLKEDVYLNVPDKMPNG